MSKDIQRAVIPLLKIAAWERAKGELHALAHLQGGYVAGSGQTERWEALRERIETFIQEIEDEELHL